MSVITELTRPVLRWHGGKWLLAPWIIENLPPHRVYVEPFGGAASVLLRKPRAYAEVYNDLDCDVVNLFRVLRDPENGARLADLVRLTPFARTEQVEAYDPTDDAVEQARKLIVRSFMGFGRNGTHRATGFRANSNRSGTTPARDWFNYPEALAAVVERLRGVTIENRDACEVMAAHDTDEALHYVDPPYLPDTRDAGGDYAHELTAEDHGKLLAFLGGLKGAVVLSGYPHSLYDDSLPGWTRIERAALADGARARTEVLWINPQGERRLHRSRGLFGAAA
ncbi:DNA adenine methylase [Brevundimonas pondensis]|uniref:DNA adenine methylase n=1 Tax=Brevundimonas pondensis TaxID=2774189 RepID=A0ABX7SP10_9CAUL|nr:DNA adenine methylase [Brevundimonas pondensis]QTC88065.1 DNA adenine methylase [Brevundimonas pondensis]